MNIAEHLAARGVLASDTPVLIEELGGGVSSDVVAVSGGGRRLVVKQALDRFKVADDWRVDRRRVVTEAQALQLAGRLQPDGVPPVIDIDPETYTLIVERAPAGWRVWKDLLLDGHADATLARRLGELLAGWHAATAGDQILARRFDHQDSFREQRVDPYFMTLQERRPVVAGAVGEVVARMLSRRLCLTHGDFSPKNVLFSPAQPEDVWVVDWEVAHHGDPAFDAAFLLTHLSLKAIHQPGARRDLQRCAQAFWDTWSPRLPAALPVEAEHVYALVGCLVLARVDGKSPAEYLSEPEREQARALGEAVLASPPTSVDRLWRQIPQA